MTKVQTYCTTWKASVGSTMIDYGCRDSLPDLYVDYHEYKALEAELTQLRTENARLISALEHITDVCEGGILDASQGDGIAEEYGDRYDRARAFVTDLQSHETPTDDRQPCPDCDKLRTESARLISALNQVAWVLHDQHDEFEALTIAHDVLDALDPREGGEDERV